MDSKYFLLISRNSDQYETPELVLRGYDTYSELWHELQDALFLDDIRWYQIYWGDTLIMQRFIH